MADRITISERIVKLETLMEQSLNEIKELRTEVKQMGETLVTKAVHDADILEVKTEIKALNKKRWVQNTLSAIMGVVMTFLVTYFVNNIGR